MPTLCPPAVATLQGPVATLLQQYIASETALHAGNSTTIDVDKGTDGGGSSGGGDGSGGGNGGGSSGDGRGSAADGRGSGGTGTGTGGSIRGDGRSDGSGAGLQGTAATATLTSSPPAWSPPVRSPLELQLLAVEASAPEELRRLLRWPVLRVPPVKAFSSLTRTGPSSIKVRSVCVEGIFLVARRVGEVACAAGATRQGVWLTCTNQARQHQGERCLCEGNILCG